MRGFDPVALEMVEAEAVADAFGAGAVRVGGAVCAVRADFEDADAARLRDRGYVPGHAWVKFHRPIRPTSARTTSPRGRRRRV